MVQPIDVFFWRKLDGPGHDSCRLLRSPAGWRLCGAAVFLGECRACHFQYEVTVDAAFRTRRARVAGYLGDQAIDIRIGSTTKGLWRVDGLPCAEVAGFLDVDLGFTPATNLLALRRLALDVGEQAQAPAAYLEFPAMRLKKLPQRYERIGPTEYAYEAPTVGYAGTLQVLAAGAVVRYPGLFELISPH